MDYDLLAYQKFNFSWIKGSFLYQKKIFFLVLFRMALFKLKKNLVSLTQLTGTFIICKGSEFESRVFHLSTLKVKFLATRLFDKINKKDNNNFCQIIIIIGQILFSC
jgi:hypothetical protein